MIAILRRFYEEACAHQAFVPIRPDVVIVKLQNSLW